MARSFTPSDAAGAESEAPARDSTEQRDLLDMTATGNTLGQWEARADDTSDLGTAARAYYRWGSKFRPPLSDAPHRKAFQRICESIAQEVSGAQKVMEDGKITEEGAGVIAEILNHLERLYDCPFGDGESLKGVLVALQSQLNNSEWSQRHVDFLRDAIAFLRVRYVVDETTVQQINDMMEQSGLDVFRGTVMEPEVIRRFNSR